jgi:carbon storage regulator
MQMLILTRSPGQIFFIGDDIVVEVLDVHGQQVRLGLTAPKDVIILRQELAERMEQAQVSTAPGRKPTP